MTTQSNETTNALPLQPLLQRNDAVEGEKFKEYVRQSSKVRDQRKVTIEQWVVVRRSLKASMAAKKLAHETSVATLLSALKCLPAIPRRIVYYCAY